MNYFDSRRRQEAIRRATQAPFDRNAGLIEGVAGTAVRRELEAIERATHAGPRSIAAMPWASEHVNTIRDAIAERERVLARSRIGNGAIDAVERVRRSSVRFAHMGNEEIWAMIARAREARTNPILEQIERARRLEETFERIRAVEKALKASDDHTSKRMVFLLAETPWGYALRVKERILAEGPGAFVDLLAEVLLEERATAALRDAVSKSETLSKRNRQLLDHALDHLESGEFVLAFPGLITGVEGALRNVARARGVRKNLSNARAAARYLKVEREHELLIAAIWAAANDDRHGEGDDHEEAERDARDNCVLALLAMLVWIQEEHESPVLKVWLSNRLTEVLAGGYLAA
jgi:hypothetical protein